MTALCVHKVARGSVDPKRPHLRQIVVAFSHDDFARVQAFAARENVSFAEAVRTLCEWGLDDALIGDSP